MKTLKKVTAVFLAVAMFLSMGISANYVRAEDTSEEYPALILNQETGLIAETGGERFWLSFTPETDGHYYFQSTADETMNPWADLYLSTEHGNTYLGSNEDGGMNWNFKLGHSLKAGVTYYLYVGVRDAGAFGVVVTESPFQSIMFEPVSIVEGTMGYYANHGLEDEYFHYNSWVNAIRYHATMKNGVVVSGNGVFIEYDGERYQMDTSDSQYSDHWYVGNSYQATASVGGCTGTVPVSIVESPIESIVIQPITFVQNSGGWLQNQGTDDEWYQYYWWNNVNYTITMKDGQVITGMNNQEFNYNGQTYWLSQYTNDEQSSENPWLVGNTYTGMVKFMGCEATVSISITDTPVQSIEVSPITIIENSYGSICNEGSEDEYWRYEWWNKINYTITMKNGQVIRGTNGSSFEYNGQHYWFGQYTKDGQSAENPWTVNQTYNASFDILGYTKEVQVSIIDTPVEKVEIEPISIMEGTCGGINNIGSEYEFYCYHWYDKLNYKITMKDGHEITGQGGSGFEYDGQHYWPGQFTSDGQSHESPWQAGNTYKGTINILGYTVEVPITIKESPVQSISFEPIVIAENTNGSYWYGATPDDQWFRYEWQHLLQWTVTMKDGSVQKGSGPSVWINGEYSSTSYEDYQHSEHWYPGNTYTVAVSALGKTADVKISICEIATEDGFEYMIQDEKAIIIGYDSQVVSLTIPDTLAGYPVVAVTDLTFTMETLQELTIPDSVTMLSKGLFDWNYDLVKLNLGTGIANLSNEMFIGAKVLQEIYIAEGNPSYTSVDGVVYDKEVTELVVFPRGKQGTYTVPDTVTEISCLIDNIRYYEVELDLGNSNTAYVVEDGVIYNKDKTVVYACITKETGKYVMPDSVETINEGAFKNCTFSEVVVSENVSEIVYTSFAYSMELEKVVLPDNLEAIGVAAFDGCESLVEAELPEGLALLEDSAFRRTAVKNVTIPSTLKEVGYSAYKEAGVEELVLEEGVEVIWDNAFYKTKIKNVVLPNSLTHIGEAVFSDAPLETVMIGTGLSMISESAFENTNLTSVTLPENIGEIGDYAFANTSLEELVIMRDDVYIYEGAFRNCPLAEIDLKEGVVAIGDYAFYGNVAESIVIPSSVTDVTYKSFAESKKLIKIDVPDELNSIDGTAFDGTAWYEAQADGVVYLENYLYGYKGEMPENTEIVVGDGTTLIANYAFENEYNLKALHLPGSLRSIGAAALEGCFGLEKITVSEDNNFYMTNADGTVLYDKNKNPVWRRVEEILGFNYCETYVEYGTNLEEWLANYVSHLVDVRYADDSYGIEGCHITADMVSGYDSTQSGWQMVTIDFGRITCGVEICVVGQSVAPMVGIKVSRLPNRTSYDLNQSFRTTGMVVKGVNADGTEFEIEDYEVYGFDSSMPGMKTITVSYMGYETGFDVEVVEERITYTAGVTEEGKNIEISSNAEAIENGAQLVVEEKAVLDMVEEALEVPEIFKQNQSQIFDIRFEKEEDGENVEIQPSETVIVSIPVPEGMDGRNSKVYHLTDGEAVDMKATFSGGFLVFQTTHFSYFGIVEVSGSSISGQIDYSDVVAGDVTVTLINGEEEREAVIAVDGSYNFTALEDGVYIVRIEKTGHAVREYEVIIGGESVEQDGQIRLMGDVNGDGEVNVNDWEAVRDHINESIFVEGYDYSCADIDRNGKINIRDWNALKAHMDESKLLW